MRNYIFTKILLFASVFCFSQQITFNDTLSIFPKGAHSLESVVLVDSNIYIAGNFNDGTWNQKNIFTVF